MAKINPTSPRGAIPQPIIHLFTPGPATKPAANLPTNATAVITKAIPTILGSDKVLRSTCIPVTIKNKGTRKSPNGAIKRSKCVSLKMANSLLTFFRVLSSAPAIAVWIFRVIGKFSNMWKCTGSNIKPAANAPTIGAKPAKLAR